LQSINQDQISISPFGGSLDYMKAKKQQRCGTTTKIKCSQIISKFTEKGKKQLHI
jgi:hypothetical protein